MTLLCFCHNLVTTRYKSYYSCRIPVFTCFKRLEYFEIENMVMTSLPLTQTNYSKYRITAVLEHVASLGADKFAPGVPLEAGVLDSRCGRGCVPFMEGSNAVTNTEAVTRVIQGQRVTSFFEKFLGGKVITFDHKWLRGVHKVKFKKKSFYCCTHFTEDAFTGVHVDNVYMGRGTQELLTMWSPLGDTSLDMGCLALVPGSHNQQAFTRFQVTQALPSIYTSYSDFLIPKATYGECDLERENITGSGWFTENPREIQKMLDSFRLRLIDWQISISK